MTIRNRRQLMTAACVLAVAIVGLPQNAKAATEQQAQEMVAKAVALYADKGEAAIAIFNEGKATGFADGEVYIVVQSRGPDGKVLAHGANSKLVGARLSDISDPNNLKFGQVMSAEATPAGGWFEYGWPNPETGQVGRKKSWAVLYQDLVFIAGIYLR
jgi:cytochrome c